MCGIIGYIGKTEINKNLVTLLKNLEYRGYDSAGTCVLCENQFKISRSLGNIEMLEKNLLEYKSAKIGIAHTRWATHGSPCINNTHPHTSMDDEFAIVHNGIIENFAELKSELVNDNNIKFYGETDTEVIANLIACQKEKNTLSKIISACKKLVGSFALAIICKSEPNKIYLVKNKSPLYVAQNKTEIICASDPICFAGKCKKYYSLNDMEFAVMENKSAKKHLRINNKIIAKNCDENNLKLNKKTKINTKTPQKQEKNIKNITFFNKNGKIISKSLISLNIENQQNGKGKYPHFMLKEIEETKNVLQRISEIYKNENPLKIFTKDFINKFNNIILIGCGTAYHASVMGAKYLEKIARIKSQAHIASEFRYSNPIIDEKTLCIFISQSGETADTIACMELTKKLKATTIALTNVLYSSLAQNVDYVLPVCAGREIAVASTKAYTAQISIMYMIANYIKDIKDNLTPNYYNQISTLCEIVNSQDTKVINALAKEIAKTDKVFFIGRDLDYITCEEASLKLKEISYINCSALASGELKHGFLALIESGTPVFVVATNPTLLEKTLNGAHEAMSRGAKIIFVSTINIPKEKTKNFYMYINLFNVEQNKAPITSIIFFQLLAYYTSCEKGLNPDQPRNLAKSVTVE